MAATTAQNPTDDAEDASELPPTAETVTRNSPLGVFCVKGGYLYLIGLNLLVLFYDDVPLTLQVLSTSIVCIIIGSFLSLRHPNSVDAQEVERMKPKDAYMFPVFGSMALCSFYVAIKYLPKYVLDVAANAFFVFMSAVAAQAFFEDIFTEFMPSALYSLIDVKLLSILIGEKELFTLPIADKKVCVPTIRIVSEKKKNSRDTTDVRIVNIITLCIGCVVAYLWYVWEQHWFFNNIIGISLSIQAVSFLNPGSYYTSVVLLSLLFFYDIFWVFGTDVMVTVAKNLKAPIKLIFPRPAVSDKPNMLGLGDIVLPGIYIALLLRYDVLKTFQKVSNFKGELPSLNWSTFAVGVVCYVLSLSACLVCMWVFDAAQPALLYICPGIILPVMMAALLRGDFSALWSYDEEPEENDDKKDD